MKIRSQSPAPSVSDVRPPAPKPVRNEVAPASRSPLAFKDELAPARPQPRVQLNPGPGLGEGLDKARELANGAVAQLQEQLLPAAYPETPAAHARELERIQGLLAEKADWGTQEQAVLDQIDALGVSQVDVWHGSHVVVNDGGALYEQWSQLASAQARGSSHYKDVDTQQFEIDFPPHGALLFGKDADGNTWFQMENHGGSFDPLNPRDYYDGAAHLGDYAIHKLTGNMNVGPFGVSPHSEKEGRQLVVEYPGG